MGTVAFLLIKASAMLLRNINSHCKDNSSSIKMSLAFIFMIFLITQTLWHIYNDGECGGVLLLHELPSLQDVFA